jgi:curved DNA-binding protein CbpA
VSARTQSPDYYAVLGVSPDATLVQIRRAYRKLARQHHPDRNPGDPCAANRFQAITMAYEVLADPDRRAVYDATRPVGPNTLSVVPQDDDPAISALVKVLEDIWRAIRTRHVELPPVVIIIASGTDRKEHVYGYHAPDRWYVGTSQRTEIMISGEGLRRDPNSVLGTLLHEAAHALAAARGIKDTSRQGRYHNKRFKALAEELGLAAESDPAIGWSLTTVPEATACTYLSHIADLAAAMLMWRTSEPETTPTQRRSSNLLAAICPCGRSIRAAASTLADADILCTACDNPFTPKDADA